MREIKFRIWDMNEKKWVWGPGYEISLFGEIILMGELAKGLSIERLNDLVAHQFTGLKDKNGKEIYEGDILQEGHHGQRSFFSVEWNESWAKFVLRSHGSIQYPEWNRGKAMEIIGNIHESQELLK